MSFIRISDLILNTKHIVCVTKNFETTGVSYESENDPFGENIKTEKGIRIFTISYSGDSYHVLENETIDSFFQKIGGLNETNR